MSKRGRTRKLFCLFSLIFVAFILVGCAPKAQTNEAGAEENVNVVAPEGEMVNVTLPWSNTTVLVPKEPPELPPNVTIPNEPPQLPPNVTLPPGFPPPSQP